MGETATGTTTRQPGAERLALALDTDDLVAALRMARGLAPWFSTAKVGLELFAAAGPDAVVSLAALGYQVFIDVKLHDIPTTVAKASRVLGALGGSYVTLHTSGGVDMLHAGVQGLVAGADAAGLAAPVALGVTVLTSDADAPGPVLASRVRVAVAAGCGGVVCAATDLATVHDVAPDLFTMVPGIRPAGTGANDQQRVATPAAAIGAGASMLVIGRAVTASDDPAEAARLVAAEVAEAAGNR
jgi:orotidine-5'-phosphate decarboxylase